MAIESIPSASVTPATPPEARTAQRSAAASKLAASTNDSPAVEKKPAVQPPASEAQLQTAVKAANDFIKPINNGIEFSLDKESDKMIVKVVDVATKEVIRQFPSEEMIALAQALDKIQGLLIKQNA